MEKKFGWSDKCLMQYEWTRNLAEATRILFKLTKDLLILELFW